MSDNATFKDTLIVRLETRLLRIGHTVFPATEARLRCFPHTTHLAVLKRLEAIDAVKKPDPQSQAAYQEMVTMRVERDHEDDGPGDDKGDAKDELDVSLHLKAVPKIRCIVFAVQSSPQWHQLWFEEFQAQHQPLLKLILDVCTRWSSTYQMLCRALNYRATIDGFVYHNWDLRHLEITDAEWNAIGTVADWSKVFHPATTQISRTQQSMLSTTHMVFQGLQDHQHNIIYELPWTYSMPPRLKRRFIETHCKLSDYYESEDLPYYMRAAGYEALRRDFVDDSESLDSPEASVTRVRRHLNADYSAWSAPPPVVAPYMSIVSLSSHWALCQKLNSPQQYQQGTRRAIDKIDVFLEAVQQDSDPCDPIPWWYARRHQFPHLYSLTRNVLAIPGSAVVIERIFSSSRDTTFLCRARVSPETIRTLMIVKQHLRLAHSAVDELTAL
ncbi:Transposase-like protein [Mycena venus]|uniref:Transposase-like protein n=1 Tax=Mycena venus TaxID=2733690 RepID=A0A8H6Z8C1_9AGAR|nr:Transposase-like protein [Mycena venus]